ncbi:Thioredoxin [Chitinophaga costaii]|uniref:Thioredoxin n=1 Tax=Chitinophaga costaii TaxID=1335309 RepID=A0A1C4E8P2_9BACT|nr:thioredoxin domain-containing protein [Chitinophaga costaii]PUZ24248.1 DUF255 domain-containing protein [Chitinophaga costaii]SCC39910.1 Thioredoxin [Chitinophaga costaii]
MRILHCFILLLLASFPTRAQNREIAFQKDALSAALQEGKTTGKTVFVDCYTQWCGPCKAMAATVFKTDSVADFFNAHLISVSLDMEQGEGLAAMKKYKIGAFPSFLLLNVNGDILYKFVGAMSANEFMEKIRAGLQPDNKIAVMNRQYAEGNRQDSFISNYIRTKLEMMEITEGKQLAKEYFHHLSDKQRTAASNWFLFAENRYRLYLSDVHSENFAYLCANWRAFVKENGKAVVENRLGDMYRKIAAYALEGFYFKKGYPYNKAEFDTHRRELMTTDLPDKDQLLLLMDIAQAAGEEDKLKVSNLLADHIDHFSPQNQRIAYSFWTFCNAGTKIPIPRLNEISEKILQTSQDHFLTGMAKSMIRN